MKRSEINALIREAEAFFAEHRFTLPPWGYWSREDWRSRDPATCREIFDHALGWDLTDFGRGDYDSLGLLLFTVRNGKPGDRVRSYAEKIMIVKEGQVTPLHFHWSKAEDIINRGGGNLVIELFGSDADEELTRDDVTVSTDGVVRVVPAGEPLVLKPGESITLMPGMYHRFYGQEGSGTVLVGEVSTCNDDNADNRFHEELGRFPDIDEDEAPYRLLVNDYGQLVGEDAS